MKRTILLASCSALGIIISNAQITITSADIVGVGKVLYQANDTLNPLTIGAINPGPAGANKTWNFSNLLSSTVDTSLITNPAWTAGAASFPNSNLAVINEDSSIFYLENTPTGLFIDGGYGDFSGQGVSAVIFNPKEEVTSFPNTYNSSFQNTSGYVVNIPYSGIPGVDSVRVKAKTVKDVKTDGWGSITTPLGTYNCIRQKGKVISTDSLFLHTIAPAQWVPFDGAIDTSWHFSWFANGVGFTLLEMDSLKGDTINNVVWLKTLPVAGEVHENAAFKGLIVFPNPSEGKFHLIIPNTVNNAIAEVYNTLGEKVYFTSLEGSRKGSAVFDLSSQSDGIYYMKVSSAEGTAIRKLVLNK